jgi:hypothetical protein
MAAGVLSKYSGCRFGICGVNVSAACKLPLMNVIDEIKTRLQKYPQVKFEIESHQATIFPLDENGFKVTMIDNAPGYTVYFDAWHEEFANAEDALNCFTFGLSDDCRLKITYQGNSPYVWVVEEKGENREWFPCQWIGCNEMGLLAPPLFWLKKRHVYLQNTLLKSGKNGD